MMGVDLTDIAGGLLRRQRVQRAAERAAIRVASSIGRGDPARPGRAGEKCIAKCRFLLLKQSVNGLIRVFQTIQKSQRGPWVGGSHRGVASGRVKPPSEKFSNPIQHQHPRAGVLKFNRLPRIDDVNRPTLERSDAER